MPDEFQAIIDGEFETVSSEARGLFGPLATEHLEPILREYREARRVANEAAAGYEGLAAEFESGRMTADAGNALRQAVMDTATRSVNEHVDKADELLRSGIAHFEDELFPPVPARTSSLALATDTAKLFLDALTPDQLAGAMADMLKTAIKRGDTATRMALGSDWGKAYLASRGTPESWAVFRADGQRIVAELMPDSDVGRVAKVLASNSLEILRDLGKSRPMYRLRDAVSDYPRLTDPRDARLEDAEQTIRELRGELRRKGSAA